MAVGALKLALCCKGILRWGLASESSFLLPVFTTMFVQATRTPWSQLCQILSNEWPFTGFYFFKNPNPLLTCFFPHGILPFSVRFLAENETDEWAAVLSTTVFRTRVLLGHGYPLEGIGHTPLHTPAHGCRDPSVAFQILNWLAGSGKESFVAYLSWKMPSKLNFSS